MAVAQISKGSVELGRIEVVGCIRSWPQSWRNGLKRYRREPPLSARVRYGGQARLTHSEGRTAELDTGGAPPACPAQTQNMASASSYSM